MAKKPAQNPTETTTTPEAPVVAPEAPTGVVAPAAPAVSPSEMVVAPKEPTRETMVHLSKNLPHLKERLNKVIRPSFDELNGAINAISDENKRNNLKELLAKLTEEPEGMHTNNRGLRLPELRIYQGTGDDANKPETTPTGGIYGTDGAVLTVPAAFASQWKAQGVGTEMRFLLICMIDARTFWPPRDEPNFSIEGVEVKKNVPICRSLDRNVGNKFGDCASCSYRPFKDGQPSKVSCRDEAHAYVITEDFKHIYRLLISSTSMKTAATPIKKKVQNWPKPWSYYFNLTAKAENKDMKKWFVFSPTVAVDENSPQGINTPIEIQKVMSLLCRQIDCDIYYPQLSEIYGSASETESTDSAEDLQNIVNNATKELPDYSKNNTL